MDDHGRIQATINERFPGYLGIRLTKIEQDEVIGELDVHKALSTLSDTLHGGAIMGFGDTLGAIGAVVNLRDCQWTTTIDSSTKFMAAPEMGTTVTGRSRPLHRGGRTMVWHTEIFNHEHRLCATVTQTQLIIAKKN